jgi:hypothetical protein
MIEYPFSTVNIITADITFVLTHNLNNYEVKISFPLYNKDFPKFTFKDIPPTTYGKQPETLFHAKDN